MYDISAFIFPFRMKNPTPMYISIMAQAFFFNLVNGPLQVSLIRQIYECYK